MRNVKPSLVSFAYEVALKSPTKKLQTAIAKTEFVKVTSKLRNNSDYY